MLHTGTFRTLWRRQLSVIVSFQFLFPSLRIVSSIWVVRYNILIQCNTIQHNNNNNNNNNNNQQGNAVSFLNTLSSEWTSMVAVIHILLSTHADSQGVDISVTVCLFVCVCVFVRLRITTARMKLTASNFAGWFRGVLDRESPILGNLAAPEAPTRTNRPPPESIAYGVYPYPP